MLGVKNYNYNFLTIKANLCDYLHSMSFWLVVH